MPSSPKRFRSNVQHARTIQSLPRSIKTSDRGYGWQWQKLRLVVLTDEPLCRFCNERGLIVAAEEVDHIDGDSFNNDRDNLRPLCRACHLERTAKDQAFGRMMWRPDWLKPSVVPLHIVCGPPASGKSTMVRENAGHSDLVMDLDDIVASLGGAGGHDWDRTEWLPLAIRRRNEMLGDIARRPEWPAAWLILSEAKAEYRQWWADKVLPASITVMEVPASVCVLRVRSEPDRNVRATEAVIAKWWSDYTRRTGDVRVGVN